jgi:branched-chain amino acid transport system permease protein
LRRAPRFAVGILGLLFDTYWQYVLAISISAAVIGGALAMLVGYARCITIATGAMMAIGAYGAAIPVVAGARSWRRSSSPRHWGRWPVSSWRYLGCGFRSHNLAMITLVFQFVVIIVLRESKTLTGGAEGIPVPPPEIFGVSFADDAYFLLLCGVLCALAILPMAVLLAGPFGKNLRAIASNENAARVRYRRAPSPHRRLHLELGADRVRGRGLRPALPSSIPTATAS